MCKQRFLFVVSLFLSLWASAGDLTSQEAANAREHLSVLASIQESDGSWIGRLAARAGTLSIAEYGACLAGGSKVARYDLWVHYVEVNRSRLSLDAILEIVRHGLSQEPSGIGVDAASIYADVVLAHPEWGVEVWMHAVRNAPDTQTGDGLAFAYLKAGYPLTNRQARKLLGLIENPTILSLARTHWSKRPQTQ